jgi:hypothetical protein
VKTLFNPAIFPHSTTTLRQPATSFPKSLLLHLRLDLIRLLLLLIQRGVYVCVFRIGWSI